MHRSAFRVVPVVVGCAAVVIAGVACKDDVRARSAEDIPERRAEQLSMGKECANAKVAKIVVVAPVSGAAAGLGLGVRNAVDLAVRQANHDCRVDGWRLALEVRNEGAPADASGLAAELVRDSAVVGVVGPLSSEFAAALAPALSKAGIPLVSPAASADSLTRPAGGGARPHRTFFRLGARDSEQPAFAAEHVRQRMKVDAAGVLVLGGDGTAAAGFRDRFSKQGGRVVAEQKVAAAGGDAKGALDALKGAQAKVVFVDGTGLAAGQAKSLLPTMGWETRFVGMAAMCEDAYPAQTKQAGEGDLCVSPQTPADLLDDADDFAEAYRLAGFKESYSDLGPLAYDAARVLIEAADEALSEQDAVARDRVLAEVQGADLKGASGRVEFDEYGDDRHRLLTVFEVRSSQWIPVSTYPMPAAAALD